MTLAIASPNLLHPIVNPHAVYTDAYLIGERWYRRYWFKFNLWIAVFTFVASYFWTEYFFDVLKVRGQLPCSIDPRVFTAGLLGGVR